MTPPRARLAVVGAGRMGKVHAANLASRCESATLVAVFDAEPAAAGLLAGRLGVPATASLDELLSRDDLAGVVVATPTASHAELAAAAAAAGKHVFCEKPLSLDRQRSVEVIEKCSAAGVKLQVGFNRRFDSETSRAAAMARSGELGELYFLRLSQRDMAPPPTGFLAGSGGIFLDMGIHDFDAARLLVGEVESLSAQGTALSDPGFAEINDYDTAVCVLRFSSGALGVIDLSRVAGYGYESSAELVGSRATLRIEMPALGTTRLLAGGTASSPLLASYDQRYGPAFAAELESFARAILDDGEPLVTGRDGLAAFDLAVAATESARAGRPVTLADGASDLAADHSAEPAPDGLGPPDHSPAGGVVGSVTR